MRTKKRFDRIYYCIDKDCLLKEMFIYFGEKLSNVDWNENELVVGIELFVVVPLVVNILVIVVNVFVM